MQKQNENAMNNFIFESIVHKFENMNHNHDYLIYLFFLYVRTQTFNDCTEEH